MQPPAGGPIGDMKRIVILLEEKWNTDSLPDAAAAVRAFREYGFDTDLWILGEKDKFTGEQPSAEQPSTEREDAKKEDAEQEAAGAVPGSYDTLYMADSARLLRQLAEAGAAFCAYSHGGNSGSLNGNAGEDLSAAEYILMEPQWVDKDSLVKIWQRQRNIPWTILETERCIVREFVPEDTDALYDLYDEEARRFLEPPSGNRSLEREILTSYIRRVYRLCGYGHWAVICKNTGELIGRMGFAFPPSPGPMREPATTAGELGPERETAQQTPAQAVEESAAEDPAAEDPVPVYDPVPDAMFGYLVRSDRRRQGITREVGAAILQYGFKKLGFTAIGADAAVSNTVSDKILRNFSFIPVAEVQKQRYYILHETNWARCPARKAQGRQD